MKKFTIFLPVRNGIDYMQKCVHSVLSQTYPHFELCVVIHDNDDGSLEWLSNLKEDRIRIENGNNINGITANWARIKTIPKNEFMTIIGYDDILLPNYLEQMNALIDAHPEASLYQAHFNYINSAGEVVRKCQPMPEVIPVNDFLQREFEQSLDSMGTGYMMRSKDYDALGGIPEHYPNLIFADYELWVRLTGLSYLAVSQEILFEYRLHNSVSKVTNGEDYAKAYFTYLDFLQQYQKENSKASLAIQQSGARFMMDFCESLSHRILKTPIGNRKISVENFVAHCEEYAQKLLPQYTFKPRQKSGIAAAIFFDKNGFTRSCFKTAKKIRDAFA